MKILLETHPLREAGFLPVIKTGVYRVVEQLANGLARTAHDAHNDLQVTFHATDHPWRSFQYFQRQLSGPHTSFAAGPAQLALARGADRLHQFAYQTKENRRAVWRGLRWAAVRSSIPMRWSACHLTSQQARHAQVYHSPFLPISESVRRHHHLRCFTTIYDLIPITHPEWFDSAVVRLLRNVIGRLTSTDHIVCISHATRRALLEHAPQLDPARVLVVHLAAGDWCRPEADPARITSVHRRVGLPEGSPYFLSLCTLEPRKNLDTIIRAFVRLKRQQEIDARFRLVLVGGTGWKTEKIATALAEAQEHRDAILLTGFVPDEDLPALYSGARAFVYLSRLEGFGLPPLEAMQCGAPVIASCSSSLPEVVGDAGILLDPDDLDGLCAAMLSLNNDDALRADLAARSLRQAATFGWDRFIQQHLTAYRKALAT